MLTDSAFLSGFIRGMRRRLLEAYTVLTEALDKHRIPVAMSSRARLTLSQYLPASAGLFLCVDLRKWLRANTSQAEVAMLSVDSIQGSVGRAMGTFAAS